MKVDNKILRKLKENNIIKIEDIIINAKAVLSPLKYINTLVEKKIAMIIKIFLVEFLKLKK